MNQLGPNRPAPSPLPLGWGMRIQSGLQLAGAWVARRYGDGFAGHRDVDEDPVSPWAIDETLRPDHVGGDIEQVARDVAAHQSMGVWKRYDRRVERRLVRNERTLTAACLDTLAATAAGRAITPAADWLVDNFHVVQDQIQTAKGELAEIGDRCLPLMSDGPLRGEPRILGAVWGYVEYTDGHVDRQELLRYLDAYQKVRPLDTAEIWTIAIALRVVLVACLSRLAGEIRDDQMARDGANDLVKRLLEPGDHDMADSVLPSAAQPLTRAFAVQLSAQLRDEDPRVAPALAWLDAALAAQSTTTNALLREEEQRQGAANLTSRNIITSMRLMAGLDWQGLFESVSLVDAVLRNGGHFDRNDLQTRGHYRRAIANLAHWSGRSETEVATRVLATANQPDADTKLPRDPLTDPRADPGYWLIAAGRPAFEVELGCRTPFWRRVRRIGERWALRLQMGITSVAALAIAIWLVGRGGEHAPPLELGLLGLVALGPAAAIAAALVSACFRSHRIQLLPGLALTDGIPASLRTLVVLPGEIASPAAIDRHLNQLEIAYLANSEAGLFFALLVDWPTSSGQNAPAAVVAGLAELNRRHVAPDGLDRFSLIMRDPTQYAGRECNRHQTWNALGRWLRGEPATGFVRPDASAHTAPVDIRYLIGLGADVRLPRDTVRRLIGKIAHPLNPTGAGGLTRSAGRSVSVQPIITATMSLSGEGSRFQHLLAATAVTTNPRRQRGFADHFHEFSADVCIRDVALHADGAFGPPDAAGASPRAEAEPPAIDATDILVFAALPRTWASAADAADQATYHLWEICRNRPGWQTIGNACRTLFAPWCLAALAAGWTLRPAPAGWWTTLALAALALPGLLRFLSGLIPALPDQSLRLRLWRDASDLRLALAEAGLRLAFLPQRAWTTAHAILRAIAGWPLVDATVPETPLDQTQPTLAATGWRMGGGLGLAGAIIGLSFWLKPETWALTGPIGLAWLAAPALTVWLARPASGAIGSTLSAPDRRALRAIARRTWAYFETFVTPADHMLPPDNFQQDPNPVVAHRTSPTNMGLHLLSIIAAGDFGWISRRKTIDQLEATLHAMQGLERHRGHFYNWYGTLDALPLQPKYISAVDSGNLAGHLVVVWSICKDLLVGGIIDDSWRLGIEDALDQLRAVVEPPIAAGRPADMAALVAAMDAMTEALHLGAVTPVQIALLLKRIVSQAEALSALVRTSMAGAAANEAVRGEAAAWSDAVLASARDHHDTLATLAPWVEWNAADPAVPERSAAMPTLQGLPGICEGLAGELAAKGVVAETHATEIQRRIDCLNQSGNAARDLAARCLALADLARRLFDDMDFGFLLDKARGQLSIGYRVAESLADTNTYDLLASEARLASFIGIAKGDLPVDHWHRLGRGMVPVDGSAALVSWSGSMFEYLMPTLVLREPPTSLMAATNREIVKAQIAFGKARDVPWGVSESTYNARDLDLTYQYSSFGIPEIGFKHGLGNNTVIAPYATALAAMIAPAAAVKNFAALASLGAVGRYGFYDALDFTPSRVPDRARFATIKAFMAHHQGMTLVALADVLGGGRIRRRFHAEPMIAATDLVLQERVPQDIALLCPILETTDAKTIADDSASSTVRRFITPHSFVPRTHLLSNGRYTVMMTAAGSGYSRWHDTAVTRWREDTTCDPWGSFIFLRDRRSGKLWSAGYQPTGVEPDRYNVAFSEGRAEFTRSDGPLVTVLEVSVSSEHDAEVRRISITNDDGGIREIEVTSYAEIALALPATDDVHPAYAKLFVETEFVADRGVLLATRRLGKPGEAAVWAAHVAVIEGETLGETDFETDRARFLGRGRTIRAPIALVGDGPMSKTVGAVLDPIFSLRCRLQVPPSTTVRVAFWTLVASSRDAVLHLVDQHLEPQAFERATSLAWTQGQVQLHQLGINAGQASAFQRLANRMIYLDPTMRPGSRILRHGEGAVSKLWTVGISGDFPIVLIKIARSSDLTIVRELLLAHEYWQLKRLTVDLVILNEQPSTYVQEFQTGLETLIRGNRPPPEPTDTPVAAHIFVLRADLIADDIRGLLLTAARAVLFGHRGMLSEQLRHAPESAEPSPAPYHHHATTSAHATAASVDALEFGNGTGGFGDGGRTYVTTTTIDHPTPQPWINVIANSAFGFQVSADGGGYAWSLNSQQNQLTPWSNDPVGDAPGDVIYLRDEDTGDVFGPTTLPTCEQGTHYVARHGQGFSRFEHETHELSLVLTQFVPVADPVKISRLTIANRSNRTRRLSVTNYVEWVLGAGRAASAPFVVTEIDEATSILLARNPWNATFGERVAFMDMGGRQQSWSGDRKAFLGRHGSLDRPAALSNTAPLPNAVGAGFDPCGALQTRLTLAPGASIDLTLLLGQTATAAEAVTLVKTYRDADLDAKFAEVAAFWDETLGGVEVETPDRAMDIMLNRWLLYQTLSCRVWARAGFYQASGAFGFRDQLQDVMALCVAKPELARAQILRAAGRQFPQGDVQHWWLPTTGNGIRTRISDDRVWLAYVAIHYVTVTGDTGILDEMVSFLEGAQLKDGEVEAYFPPVASTRTASLFDHCALGLDASLAVGGHGLPLIGTGDWNDGMNRVGIGGKGESIWLGWFLAKTLDGFASLAQSRSDGTHAGIWRQHAIDLGHALDAGGWDGQWYRRAYFDDGTPLGSASSRECRIDAIAQSWAVISGMGDPAHATAAMQAVDTELIRKHDGLALLFTPPFDSGGLDAGYIGAYPPGLRENGGQYTHAALWSVIAYAMLGDGDKAGALFSLLNPINHALTPDAVDRYRVEPYVVAADIYSEPPHVGHGGWTWYTGSAGWMYRAGLESILGFRPEAGWLRMDPCIPRDWPGFDIRYRHGTATYTIHVDNAAGVNRGIASATLDGVAQNVTPFALALLDDGATHRLEIVLG